MALTSIANLVESIAKQFGGQGNNTQQATQAAGTVNASASTTSTEDTFTPSNQNNSPQGAAQEAGLFQVSQSALFAATAGSLASQTTHLQTNQSPDPAQIAPVAAINTSAALPIPSANINGPSIATSQIFAAPSVQTAPGANTQDQIQAFNDALAALGLSNNDIQKLDQIASLVNVFSPTAFSDLIGQFQALAKQAAQLSTANTSAQSSATPGGYQVQGLSIQFAGPRPSSNAGTTQTGGPGGGAQAAPGGLKLARVQFTLTSLAGQPANVVTPRQTSSTAAAG